MNNVPWGHVRAFLAVSRLGSLSAAAREIGVSQPTLSRNIQALESVTALNLFKRTTQGLRLTEAGQALVDAAGQMQEAAELFTRQASGLSLELAGDVRLSANEIVGVYLLPPAVAAFRQRHPRVQLEIVISNRASDLSKREADVALCMFRPRQPDLVARRLPDIELGLFAHRAYLAEFGAPRAFEELGRHVIIGFDEGREFIEAAADMGFTLNRADFPVRSDHLLAQLNLLRAGAGICATHVALARRWPELVRILQDVPVPPLEFWCVTHGDVQFNTRIRAVMEFLIEWFADDPYHAVMI